MKSCATAAFHGNDSIRGPDFDTKFPAGTVVVHCLACSSNKIDHS